MCSPFSAVHRENSNSELQRSVMIKQTTEVKSIWRHSTEPLKILSSASTSPKSTLRLPGNKGPKPRVASLSQLKDMTPSVRPWKQPQHETIIAWNKCP